MGVLLGVGVAVSVITGTISMEIVYQANPCESIRPRILEGLSLFDLVPQGARDTLRFRFLPRTRDMQCFQIHPAHPEFLGRISG